jgi:hypothetical protein
LATVDTLGELAVEEGVLDVELASLPFKGDHNEEDDADRGRFDNRTERLVEVNALLLREIMKHPACFVAVERAIGLQLVAKDPLARDDVGVPRRRHKIPSVIVEERTIVLGHSLEPIGILECRTCGGGNREGHVCRRCCACDPRARASARAHAPVKAAGRVPVKAAERVPARATGRVPVKAAERVTARAAGRAPPRAVPQGCARKLEERR